MSSNPTSDDETSHPSASIASVLEDEQLMLPLADLLLEGERSMAPPRQKRIYCNRNLRLDQVDFVGFDMDYTLAIYNQPEMDKLSIEATAKKLVERGYPATLLTMPYRTDFAIRGLLIDKKLGNVLKMDRYRYVKKAYHGMRELSRDERRSIYHQQRVRAGTSRYHWVDTLYALSEVSVYVAVIDELERDGLEVDYQKLFTDVRACIDLAHQDGSILDTILSDFPRFLRRDPELGATLHKLRSAGKKLFLLTNSRHGYTEKAMQYLVGGALPEYPSWRNYFDVVITAAGKPRFFAEQNPLLIVDADGSTTRQATSLEADKIYASGNILQFEQLLGASGDRVLYVGDHIYGDVLRAKKETGWRTAMILQEMSEEIGALQAHNETIRRLDSLGTMRDDLYDELRARQRRFKDLERWTQLVAANGAAAGASVADIDAARLREKRAIDRVRLRLKEIEAEYDAAEAEVDAAFHPFWGSIFKAGPEVTIFGDQVEQYACLYTERVSNLLYYSPMHYFRSPRDRMPHE